MFQTQLNPEIEYNQKVYSHTFETDLINAISKNLFDQNNKAYKIVSSPFNSKNFQQIQGDLNQNIQQQNININNGFQLSYWTAKHKKQNWEKLAELKFPFYFYLKHLKIANSNITSQDLQQIFQKNKVFRQIQTLDLISNSASLKPNTLQIINDNLHFLNTLILKNNKKILDTQYLSLLKLPNLTCLNLDNCNLQTEHLQIISKNLSNLKELNISKNFSDINLSSLNNLKKLEKLEITDNLITDLSQIKPILQNQLKYLDISRSAFQNKSCLQQLKDIETSNSIEVLLIQNQNLCEEDLVEIFSIFKELVKIDLEGNQNLAKSDLNIQIPQTKLQWLSLRQCSFDENAQHRKDELDRKEMMKDKGEEYKPFDYGFIPFHQEIITNIVKFFPNLKFIDLSQNLIKNQGFTELVQGFQNNSQKLQHLQLANCGLTHEILPLISKSQVFTELESLNLRENDIKDEGVQILVSENQFQNLKYLNLSNCKISVQGFTQLLNWESIKTVVDFRFSENVSRSNSNLYIKRVEDNLDNLKNLKKISLGGGMEINDETPVSLQKRNIIMSPFFGDRLD
ncbi:hypothetical protein PPERSA_11261 [Pseudocohnilembus persalinus]|uniref:Uncharacterized protein n=1 Tax=Pseudocohnilembus persalinus TaxID=266149 RepID=A0A0V0R085_PSEPJ|nr:hypothetical protein PPERSA_11261 [Pseudocohnilembus persalinus]|eukprot:KRX07712.1 hypothetical protein PPERSA_11261 [Pseudocohnilembus persalinus]